jgi:hypothetical protein
MLLAGGQQSELMTIMHELRSVHVVFVCSQQRRLLKHSEHLLRHLLMLVQKLPVLHQAVCLC